jgi:lysophospholipase L1-like esterase
MKTILTAALLAATFSGSAGAAAAPQAWRFAFAGAAHAPAGPVAVTPDMAYTPARGYGFEPGAAPHDGKPFYFSVDLPEGSYNVTVKLGGPAAASTTVKAELRRLMLENVQTAPGQSVVKTFTVNIRTPKIAAANNVTAGEVQLKVPRETVQEAWAWDKRLTLEFNGNNPALQALDIVPATVPAIYLLGDSTVSDQPQEPYNSWGQMLPRFFKPGIAVANYAQSGETYRDSLARRRLDKILSQLRAGDTVLMQFGHNDQKQVKEGKGGPFTTYKDEIRSHVQAIRARGGLPVIVSSMERRNFDANGKVVASLAEYAEAARQSAMELKVPFIDLNAMSKPFYEALGPERSKAAFAESASGKIDNTHHNSYGSYELAKLVVKGMRDNKLPAARFIAAGLPAIDPAHPAPAERFAVPASPNRAIERPPGDDANAGDVWLFAYFTGNGEDGLHFAASSDGYRWEKVGHGRSYLTPKVGKSKLMRDPCIVRGPDGTYHMVWTSGWNENNIGYASSKDLVNWSGQKELPVMAHEPGVLNAWAPEIVWDEKRGEFLLFWASTVPGKVAAPPESPEGKYNHRMYATTTRDFVTFTPTRLFYDPGFSVIDATFLRADGRNILLVKDETRVPARKYLQLADAPDLQGPFGALGKPFTPPGLWVEGPTAIKANGEYLVYYDAYQAKRYGAMRSRDLVNWEDVSDRMHFPDEGTLQRMRHGTVFAAPAAAVARLQEAAGPATTVASSQNYEARVPYQTYFADYLALRKGRPAELVFIGDSITEQWRWGAGAPVWKQHFEQRAFDFGLGADKTQHVLWRLQNFDLSFLNPKVAVVMIGTNNTGDTPEDIAAGVQAVIAATQAKFPGVKVVLCSILPNARANDKMAAANKLLAPLADQRRVYYLDLAAKFPPEGDNWKGLSRDKLHLTAEGYATWAAELETLLSKLDASKP